MFDSDIVHMYEKDREKAAKMVEEKYSDFCHGYASRFLSDASDLDESIRNMYTVLRQSIPPLKPSDLKLFITKILRNTAFNKYKRVRTFQSKDTEIDKVIEELGDSFITAEDKNLDDIVMMRDAGKIVDKCLKKMPSANRDVFIRRFYFVESEEEIAKRYMTTPENVRIVLENAKDRVRIALERGGF